MVDGHGYFMDDHDNHDNHGNDDNDDNDGQVVLKAINSDLVTAEEFWREHQSSAQVI